MHKSVCLFVCLFVQFFDPLPVVQQRCQGYVWIAYNPARKMKLFRIRLEQEKNFWLGIMCTENVCLSVIDVCLSVTMNFLHTLILNTLHTLFQMFVCLSQFYFHEFQTLCPCCTRRASRGCRRRPFCEVIEFYFPRH